MQKSSARRIAIKLHLRLALAVVNLSMVDAGDVLQCETVHDLETLVEVHSILCLAPGESGTEGLEQLCIMWTAPAPYDRRKRLTASPAPSRTAGMQIN